MPHKELKDSNGLTIPSVTNILGILGKSELYRWYGKHGFEECERMKREAGEWGTELHEAIGLYLKGEEISISSRSAPMLHSFTEWKERSGFKPLMIEPEEPMISSLWGYQGTFDAVGELDDELVVADWKTSARIYPEYGLQLAAYANLWNEAHNHKKHIKTGLIVRIDKKTNLVQAKGFYNLPMYFEVFKSLLPVYDFVKRQKAWA